MSATTLHIPSVRQAMTRKRKSRSSQTPAVKAAPLALASHPTRRPTSLGDSRAWLHAAVLLILALAMGIGLIVHAVQKSPSPDRSEALAQFPVVPATWAEKKARNEGARELANEIGRQRWAAGEIGFTHGAGLPLMGIALIWLGFKVHARLFAEGNSFASTMTGAGALVLIGVVLLLVALETVWIPVTDEIRQALGGLMVDYSRLTLGTSRRGMGGSNPYKTGQMLGSLVSLGSFFLWAKLSASISRRSQGDS